MAYIDSTCFLCGSQNIFYRNYLNSSDGSLIRNIGYAMPQMLANFFETFSKKFSQIYYPIKINKRYFSKNAFYCTDCNTGLANPKFSSEQLDAYYSEFYWKNRSHHDQEQILSSPSELSSLTSAKARWEFVFYTPRIFVL